MPFLFFLSMLFLGRPACVAFQGSTEPAKKMLTALEDQKKEAEALFYEGQSKAALNRYSALQQAYHKAGYPQKALRVYQDIFAVVVQDNTLKLYDKIEQLDSYRRQEQSPQIEGVFEGALSQAYGQAAAYDSMRLHHRSAVRLFDQHRQPKLALNHHLYLAHDLYYQEQLFDAKTYLEQAAALVPTCRLSGLDIEEEILVMYNLQTVVYTELSRYPQAIKVGLKIIELHLQTSTSSLELAYEYNNLATTYSCIDDYSNALRYYQKALQMTTADIPLNATITYNMGNNLLELYQQDSAVVYFRQSLKLLDKCGKNDDVKIDYINNYHGIIDCYILQDQLDSALSYSRRCMQINTGFEYRQGFTYQSFAEIYLKQKKFDLAEQAIQKSLHCLQQTYGAKSEYMAGTYSIYSEIFSQKGQLNLGIEYLQKALGSISIQFSDPKGYSNPLLHNVQDKGKLIELIQKKMALMQQVYHQDASLIQARQIFECALLATQALTEHNRSMKHEGSKINLLDKTSLGLYEESIKIAVELFDSSQDSFYLDAAFQFSEQSKSMLMTDTWHESDATTNGIPKELQEKEYDLRSKLMHYQKLRFEANTDTNLVAAQQLDERCFALKHELDELVHLFETAYPQYFAIKYSRETIGMREIQAVLPANAQVIEFFEGLQHLYIFSINKTAVTCTSIPLDANYRVQINRFQQAVTDIQAVDNNPAEMHHKLSESGLYLFNTLLKDKLNPTIKRLIIIPDGALNLIPFEALVDQEIPAVAQNSRNINFGRLPYLLKKYTISYNYSADLLRKQLYKLPSQKNMKILALAPGYNQYLSTALRTGDNVRDNLAMLPGAIREVEFLEDHFWGEYLYKQAANEQAFREAAPHFDVIHLAMHGLIDNQNPQFSSLVLDKDSQSEEDDILYAYEIQNLRLNPDLVVLSACETGVGKFQQGEGVLSIGRGFMYAGTSSLVMTLWGLNDYSGSEIIENYYQFLTKGMNKDEAMKKAKLDYIQENSGLLSHPALWACYIQMGNTDPISIKTNLDYSNWMKYLGILLSGVFLSLGLRYYLQSSSNQA